MSHTALIVGASPCSPPHELLRGLASSTHLVVAVDGGAQLLTAAGIRPDLFVGDVDSTSPALSQKLIEAGVEVAIHPAAKDVSDLHLALEACERRSIDSVIAVGVSGGRLDHELCALGVLARYAHLRPEIISNEETVWLLAEDGIRELVLQGEGRTFSVLAIRESARVSVTGARWPLMEAALEPLSDHGLSNVITSTEARVALQAGVVAVIAPGTTAERAIGRHT